MSKEAPESGDVVLDIVNQWVESQADVIPIVAGHNVLIKHPNDIHVVLTSGNYTKETGPNRYFRAHVADGLLTAPPERHRRDRLVLNMATHDHDLLDRVAVQKTDALICSSFCQVGRGKRAS